jgi:hypothetical protein
MDTQFRLVAAQVHDAEGYLQLFPRPDASDIKTRFRQMMKIVHPDRVDVAMRPEADEVMRKLNLLHDEARKAIADGMYGAPKPLLKFRTNDFSHDCHTKRSRWFDMTTGFEARSTGSAGAYDTLVRIARLPRDNDLMAVECDALRILASSGAEHHMYYPALLDSMAVQDGRKRLRANVTKRLDGFFNLEQVKERYPNGVSPLDMGWIWRRVLWALGGAHEAGLLHGAMVPRHVMIHPTLHGVVLVDWCYSLTRSGNDYPALSAIVGEYRDWYPDAVTAHTAKPTEALDLALAARSIRFIMEGQVVPDEMLRYFASVTEGHTTGSAYELLAQFDRILERLGSPYYPRSYRPLN